MGLIQAIKETGKSFLGDQWREYFYCESMSEDILVSKGQKRTSGRSQNVNGVDNIISNGSIIAVNEGQCMMIVDQGQVVEFSATPGEFVWDASTEPTILYGKLDKEKLKSSWETLKRRFTFGADTARDQRVYFFNLKEIMGNKFGTPAPIPFRVVDSNIGLDLDVSLRCNGEYSYRITDPMLFYKNVAGNVSVEYSRKTMDGMLKSEFISALQPALAEISAAGIRYSALPSHTKAITAAMNQVLTEQWSQLRGISVVSVAVNSATIPAEDEEAIKALQKSAVLGNPTMAAAHMVQAQAEAMKTAAGNEGGSMLGFLGMNMAQMAGGMNANQLFQMGQQQAPAAQPQAAAPAGEPMWTCSCGHAASGNFCMECGSPKPVADGWTCTCGSVNKGKFCRNCGTKKPVGAPLYRCDKCGWEPEDPKNPPKFCPECGDRFDEGDVK